MANGTELDEELAARTQSGQIEALPPFRAGR